jgi:hypothetical protein
MPNRLIHLMLLAVALYAGGAAIVAFSDGTFGRPHIAANARSAPPVASATPDAPIEATTTLLPTIVVRPEPALPTLATVTVRPSRSDRVESLMEVADVPSGSVIPVARSSAVASFAGAGFDMPYYSFGRTLRHVSKE